jgi:RecB family endonuclease NucS
MANSIQTPFNTKKQHMAIYEISSDKFRKIDETSFSGAGLRERQDLQRLLRSQIEIVAPDTLVISEEFSEWEDSNRRIDLLGIDKNAKLVVIELKRKEDGGHMELQSIRYAAMISTMTFARAPPSRILQREPLFR